MKPKRSLLYYALPISLVSTLALGTLANRDTNRSDNTYAQPSKSLETIVSTTEEWEQPLNLNNLYKDISKDLKESKPLIIATYMGLWIDGKEPEKNLHWGSYFGAFRMFERAKTDEHIQKNFEYHDWERIFLEKNNFDPLRTAVYEIIIEPNEFWKQKGIEIPFTIYKVFQVYDNLKQAGMDMVNNLKKDKAKIINTKKGKINLKDARIIGYNGHNFYYDGPFSELHDIKGSPNKTKGAFIIGCNTKKFFRDDIIDKNIYGLAFTTSFMAPEGYNLLSLIEGLAKGLNGDELAQKMNQSYKYFQVLGGQKEPGPLFVNHQNGLY